MNLQDVVFYIHLAALAVAALGVLAADKVGLGWMRGKTETLTEKTLFILHEVMTYSLIALIVSGLYLFWPMRDYLIHQYVFMLKMIFVLTLVVNSILIDRLMVVATKMPFASVSNNGKVVLFISGAVSFVCWFGSGLAALFFFGL